VACRACGAWNHADVHVCATCGTRGFGVEDARQTWFTQFWTFMTG
jgi:hypothetical protein